MSVTAAFSRAVDYDSHAVVQRYVAEALADRIVALPLPPAPCILEVGCGTGLLGAALLDRMPHARWLMTDIAPAMVKRAHLRFAARPEIRLAVMDGERPDAPDPFDLICSSLAAQWFAELPSAVARLRAQLTPQGKLVFTTLAAGSFFEWRQAHRDLPCGAHDYPSPRELAELGLDVSVEHHVVRYANAHEFLHALKAIGASTPRPGHRPLAPAQLRQVMARFGASGATATYVVATCLAGSLA